MELYVRRLALEWRRGPLRRYEVIEENVPFVRGKLLVRRQVRENAVRRERLACARDEFTPDNLPARLLKAAARACARQEFAPDVSGAARSLLVDMDEVGDTYVPGSAIRAPLERQHQRFEPLLGMAALILDSESPSIEAGGEKTFALMFEMHAVFEAFIATELRRALGPAYRVRAQAGPRALLQRATPAGWKPAFQLRPDVTIRSADGIVGLIDTKWKRLDGSRRWNDVAQSDIYQMYAYAMRYGAPKTILVYPRIGGFGREVDDFRIEPGPGSDVARILVRTVDVSGDLEAPSVRQQLRVDLRAIVSA
jgi:5-methylcytosine-specific restriction enzyme subunit McrC